MNARLLVLAALTSISLVDRSMLSARPPLNLALGIDGELDLDVIEIGSFPGFVFRF